MKRSTAVSAEPADTDLAAVIGQHARELRERAGLTQDDVIRGCHQAGVRGWRTDRIARFESGRAAPTLQNLLIIALGLSRAGGRPVALADLLPDHGQFALSDGLPVPYDRLAAALRGAAVGELALARTADDPRTEPGWGLADDRIVADLGLEPERVRALTHELYGHSATTERDARAGADATPQKRGRITRLIAAEVSRAVSGGGV